jgi:hypothetical protein
MTNALAVVPRDSEARVSMDASTRKLAVGSIHAVGFGDVSHHWWPDPWAPPVRTYTAINTVSHVKPNATEMAFKIVSALMEDGIVDDLTVKQFVKMVDRVAKIVKDS